MLDVDSISIRTQVCLITQETKIQKSGCQQPVQKESRDSILAVETAHMSISQDLVFRWTGSPLTSFTAGPALVKALLHLLIAFQCLFQPTPAFLFEK